MAAIVIIMINNYNDNDNFNDDDHNDIDDNEDNDNKNNNDKKYNYNLKNIKQDNYHNNYTCYYYHCRRPYHYQYTHSLHNHNRLYRMNSKLYRKVSQIALRWQKCVFSGTIRGY